MTARSAVASALSISSMSESEGEEEPEDESQPLRTTESESLWTERQAQVEALLQRQPLQR